MPKFRPSLLDTLLSGSLSAGDDPALQTESVFPGIRLYSLDRMSETAFLDTMRRDLSWLLNTVRLEDTLPLDGAPEVATSVLNFGIPDFSTRTYASVDVQDAAASMTKAIRTFEPRIEARSLNVQGKKSARDDITQSLVFHIDCNVGHTADALRAAFTTEIEVETGDARLKQDRR